MGLLRAIALFSIMGSPVFAQGIEVGGFVFEGGPEDFASGVASFIVGDPAPKERTFLEPNEILGVPDYRNRVGAVSLGNGGEITLTFDGAPLAPSGNDDPDIVIFEIGSDRETSLLSISADGETFIEIGRISQGTSATDIDAALAEQGITEVNFPFVRITDEAGGRGRSGKTAGADVDAVGLLTRAGDVTLDPPALATTESPSREATEDEAANDTSALSADAADSRPEVAEQAPPAFGSREIGHYSTRNPLHQLIERRNFNKTPIPDLGLIRAQALWLPDAILVDFFFETASQSEEYRQIFASYGGDPVRCRAVLVPDESKFASLGSTDCPQQMDLDVLSTTGVGVNASGDQNFYMSVRMLRRPNGFSQAYGDIHFIATHNPKVGGTLARASASASSPLGMGFDLAGITLTESLEEMQAQANDLIGASPVEWTEKTDLQRRTLQLFRIGRPFYLPLRSSQEMTYAEALELASEWLDRAVKRDEEQFPNIVKIFTGWVGERLEQPAFGSLRRTSIVPPADDGYVAPVESIALRYAETPSGPRPFGIVRTWTPAPNDAPSYENLIQALRDKYGDPSEQIAGLSWNFDYQGDLVRSCHNTPLATSLPYGIAPSLTRSEQILGCMVRLTAQIKRLKDGSVYELKMELIDARPQGLRITNPQWDELFEAGQRDAAPIVEQLRENAAQLDENASKL